MIRSCNCGVFCCAFGAAIHADNAKLPFIAVLSIVAIHIDLVYRPRLCVGYCLVGFLRVFLLWNPLDWDRRWQHCLQDSVAALLSLVNRHVHSAPPFDGGEADLYWF